MYKSPPAVSLTISMAVSETGSPSVTCCQQSAPSSLYLNNPALVAANTSEGLPGLTTILFTRALLNVSLLVQPALNTVPKGVHVFPPSPERNTPRSDPKKQQARFGSPVPAYMTSGFDGSIAREPIDKVALETNFPPPTGTSRTSCKSVSA